jgi:RNA polymerase sigma factor (sigma-70 family)
MNYANSKSKSDLELVEEYRVGGNREILGILFERYTVMVYGVCMKYMKDQDKAGDQAMAVFEKLFGDLKRHKIDNFKSWLYQVSKNQCLMALRSEKSQLGHLKEFQKDQRGFMENDHPLHPDNKAEKEVLFKQLEECLKELNEVQRISVELFFLQEKSYQEVSLETGFSMKEVKSYIQNGKRNLTLCMEKK